MDDTQPLFRQIAEQLEQQILTGAVAEESQVPSTNELAAFHRINPATAAKGINALVADGILYKKRGIGMFVSTGAREKLLAQRREDFRHEYIDPLLAEAQRLGLDTAHLLVMIKEADRT